ncbi:hypothetical protein EIM69_03865 [Salmonella enterica]|nr:hypothetical protein [Salmonella enterica]
MAVAGFCSSGVVLSGWSAVALAGFGWRRMWWLCLAASLLVRFRLIPPDSTKILLIPLKRYGFQQNNHGGSCSLHPAKTRHIPE